MAGIYLHIPFCKQACTYCNFHFTTSLRYKDDLLRSISSEAVAEQGYLEDEKVESIYFGGGTPSLLTLEETATLLNVIRNNYKVDPAAEVTFEANPDDISPDRIRGWKDLGINRLSIGVQSFFEEELRWMNRAHSAEQSLRCIEWSQQFGISNLSIDLIYGSPLLTDENWKANVDQALAIGIPHLSCYALTVEEKTPLHKLVTTQKSIDVNPDKQSGQFLLLMKWLNDAGYEHYEVSNFSLPGRRSRHNSSYWSGEKYLGLGPSAHSFNELERRWNISNNQVYINSAKTGEWKRESEILTEHQKLNEYIMVSLRTAEGMNFEIIENRWGQAACTSILAGLNKFNNKLLIKEGSNLRLTNEGMLMADGIAAHLFQS